MTDRRERSLTSTARGQSMEKGSTLSWPWWRKESMRAARVFWAAATAWKSPVKWTLMRSWGEHLREASAGGSAFLAEDGAERGLAESGDGLLPDVGEGLGEADGGDGLAFPVDGGGDAGDEDEFSSARRQMIEERELDFGHVGPVGMEELGWDSQRLGDGGDRLHMF